MTFKEQNSIHSSALFRKVSFILQHVCICNCTAIFFKNWTAKSTVLCLVSQSCPTLCDPTDCSPPGSSVHGDSPGKNTGVGCHAIFLTSQPRGWASVFSIAGRFFTNRATRVAHQEYHKQKQIQTGHPYLNTVGNIQLSLFLHFITMKWLFSFHLPTLKVLCDYIRTLI